MGPSSQAPSFQETQSGRKGFPGPKPLSPTLEFRLAYTAGYPHEIATDHFKQGGFAAAGRTAEHDRVAGFKPEFQRPEDPGPFLPVAEPQVTDQHGTGFEPGRVRPWGRFRFRLQDLLGHRHFRPHLDEIQEQSDPGGGRLLE